MLESVICPSCSTRYGLRPERIHSGIRRACCYKCGFTFSIETNVNNILENVEIPQRSAIPSLQGFQPSEAPLPPVFVLPEPPSFPEPEAFLPPSPAEPVVAAIPSPSPLQDLMDQNPIQTMDGIKPEDLMELDVALPEAPEMPPMEAAAPVEDPHKTTQELDLSSVPEIDEASLMLGDLDESLLDSQPEPPKESAPLNGTFSSAKDAISKLLGSSSEMPRTDKKASPRATGAMDVEATLDALENTLGGINLKELNPPPPIPGPDPRATSNSLGTIKLTTEDIQQAMAAVNAQQEPKPQAAALPPPPPAPAAPMAPPEEQLKVQLDGDTLQNLGLSQIIRMIEDGRIQDWHLVARQHSENWIEAGKIPSLRSTFERIRKASTQESSNIEVQTTKKGLFGGLFGRG